MVNPASMVNSYDYHRMEEALKTILEQVFIINKGYYPFPKEMSDRFTGVVREMALHLKGRDSFEQAEVDRINAENRQCSSALTTTEES